MILSSITLSQFRGYSKRDFSFSPAVTVIVGPNASGKTSILESIVLLSTGKSFRADIDREMIRWGEEVSSITCHVSGQDDTKLEMMITSGTVHGKTVQGKKYLVNGIPRRSIDFLRNVRAVLFWPEHLKLVTDSPSIRRRYLDSVLVQVDREYLRNLISYEKGLRQRNKLLDLINEGKAQRHQLLFWDQLLIKSGQYLTDKREEYIHFVNQYPMTNIQYQIEYDKSVISESRLAQYEVEEVAAKATLVGPHRDDIQFKIQNSKFKIDDQKEIGLLDVSKYGSRGEQRLAVLWLKLAELAYIQQEVGDRPVLLLDDIFSELDPEHRGLVMDLVKNQQTIITSADKESLPDILLQSSTLIVLDGP